MTIAKPTLTALLLCALPLLACDPGEELDTEDDSFRAKGVIPTRDRDLVGWQEWIFAQPKSTGPLGDMSGEACADGQSGPIWYLAGTLGGPAERECVMPVGKQLVFPLVNFFGAIPESYYDTPEAWEAQIGAYESTGEWVLDNTCELTVLLDGVEVYDDPSETFVGVYEPFEVSLPDDPDNLAAYFGLVGGTTQALGGGYYAHLPPLPPGEHSLEFGGSLCSGEQVVFSTHVEYTLIVD